MHELGVLRYAVRTVERFTREHNVRQVKYVTLEVGEDSGYVPLYLQKLFPIAVDPFPVLRNAQLRIQMAPGRSLLVKDIGCETN